MCRRCTGCHHCVMATNTSQRQMRRTPADRHLGAETPWSQLDKMVGDFVERKMD